MSTRSRGEPAAKGPRGARRRQLFGGLRLSRVFRQQREAKFLAHGADAIVEAQKFESGDGRARDENGCQVNGVESSDRIARERSPRTVDDLGPKAEHVPMRGGGGQVGAAVRNLCFCEFAKRRGPMKNAVAFDEREIRCEHDHGLGQCLAHKGAGGLVEQPREHGAGLCV